MKLNSWMKEASPELRSKLAAEARTSVGYLWQLAGEHRKPGAVMARRLVDASFVVTPDKPLRLEDLRPDIWDFKAA
ncbi:hypothetical protein G8770_03670 [Aestuariicella hydrocarbonica]|uniref:Uncharacterized protein n=1 Tax=Pseudomaricurvus hydrocarbonicus TaxID=1470433 RepID=A0A9E5MJ76_9GAMM|nr:hypothetical protein [Aestuariicella hydrocarbonica]NHO64644.1 hypothetical protein [Aestuariicella hydrocarbonica]